MNQVSEIEKKQSYPCGFYVVYFTCKRHLPYLLLSLKSWRNLSPKPFIRGIEICLHMSDMINTEEIEALTMAADGLPFRLSRTEEPMSRGGMNVVRNELRTFQRIAKAATDCDWIIKIDSDVLVTCSTHAFDVACTSNSSLIGNACWNYIQGGVYFLRAQEVYRLLSTVLETNTYCAKSPAHCPEDATISEQMRRGTGTIEQVSIVWNQPSLNELSISPNSCSFLHFSSGTKAQMIEAYEILVRQADLRAPHGQYL